MIRNSKQGMYALCHLAENSKGIGFITIMFMMSKENQSFILFRVYKYIRMSEVYVHQKYLNS